MTTIIAKNTTRTTSNEDKPFVASFGSIGAINTDTVMYFVFVLESSSLSVTVDDTVYVPFFYIAMSGMSPSRHSSIPKIPKP